MTFFSQHLQKNGVNKLGQIPKNSLLIAISSEKKWVIKVNKLLKQVSTCLV